MPMFRRLSLALLACLAAALLPARPAAAQGFVANQLENFLSSDTMQVEIEGLSGALTGNIRIERVTVSDPQGTFLTASDLAMDWSPLALVRSNLSIDALTAGQIVLERLPVGQPETPAGESSGFTLPSITASIDDLTIGEFVLGEAIAGERARLRANGSLTLAADPTNLDLRANIERLDRPGQIALDLGYAPGENQLRLDVKASEPAGGLVATLLDIPDRPAVELTINGSGPLSAFMANGSLTVAGEPAATLTARVDGAENGRRVAASLSVSAERFVPEAYSRYVAGGANLDVQMLMRDDGLYVIDQAELSSDALAATASGTLDLSGTGNDLTIAIASRDGSAIPFAFGTPPGATELEVAGLEGRITGALGAAGLNVTAQLPRAAYGEYVATGVDAALTSAGFDITGFQGPFAVEATAAEVAAPEGLADRFLTGPLRLAVDGALTDNGLVFNPSRATTEVASVGLQGTAALNFAIFDLAVESTFQTAALSAAMIPLAGDELAVSGRFARTPDATISAQNLSVRGEGLTIDGSASLSNDTVSADIEGELQQAGTVNSAFSGAATFSLTASGPVEQPDIDLEISGNGLSINGRELADLSVSARGTFGGGAPAGTVEITGTLDGQPLSGAAQLETLANGERRINGLAIRQGPNAITGDLTLTDAFAPVGTLTVDVEDIGPLAALGGIDASGDVKGTIELSVDGDDMPVATLDLAGETIGFAGNTLQTARIDLEVADYLGTPRPAGEVSAAAIEAAGLSVRDLAVELTREGDATGLVATAELNDVPLRLEGSASFEPGTTLITLSRIEAEIPDAEVSLREPVTIRIADGTTTLPEIVLETGDGTVSLAGTAGENLDLALRLDSVPAAIANPFVPGLAAGGRIDGSVTVSGAASDPAARFSINTTELAIGQSRAANVPPVEAVLAGTYENGTLTLETARVDLGDGSIVANGSVGETLDLDVALDNVPVALANGFVDELDAAGTVSGTASVTGSRADPSATFDIEGRDITAEEIAAAGIAPLTLDLAGSYANGTLDLAEANVAVGDGSLTASGTIGETLDLALRASDLPVGLANGFVPGLDAEGIISGTASASGSLSDPSATFDLTGSGITTREIAASGVAPLDLRLAGSYADGTADLETAVVNVGDGSLTASGRIGETLDVAVDVNSIPVGLVNGFVDGLGAEGTISGTARATGTLSDPTASFDLAGANITADGIEASGIAPLDLTASGRLADGTLTLTTARVDVGEGSLTASGTVGEQLDLQLSLDQLPVGLVNGYLPDLEAEGTISGTGTATGSLSDPRAEFDLSGSGITTRQIAQSGVAPLSLDVAGSYADGTATIANADLSVGEGSLSASGTVGETLDIDLSLDELPVGLANGFVDGLNAEGTISGSGTATGSLSDPQATFDLTGTGITTRQIAQSGVAPLSLDVAGSYADGTATIANADVTVGNGSLTASGTVGQQLDLNVQINRLPAGLANGFVDGLGAQGTIDGTATATGSISDPNARFDIALNNVSVAQGRAAGAPPINGTIAGAYAGGTLRLDRANVAIGGGSIDVTGTAGANALDLTATINNVPASIAGSAAPGIAPQGTINGTVRASGSPASPAVSYDVNVAGASIQQTRDAGVGPLAVTSNGQYTGNAVTTTTTLTGNGIDFRADGSVNLAGTPQLDLNLAGTAPLSLANGILAEGGRSLEGTARVDARVTGPVSQPNVVGSISTAGSRFVDTGTNVAVDDISTTIALNGQTATIQSFDANLASGGDISIGGSVGLSNGFPADLTINLDDGRYSDGELIGASLDADLTLTGPLAETPLLAGTVNASEINVLVPENLPGSLARIDVTHANASPEVLQQQRELFPNRGEGASQGGVALDITFNAPSRVFVRGRGLDAELGGTIQITGPANAPSIVGGFELQRGRFIILSRRLDFERGRLSFTGSLTPTLDLLARSDTGDATVNVAVTGPANDPSFTFSSSPALPQDEVLARLIFGQGTSNLSPLQIAQLAEAAASLAGVGGSTGLLENLRAQLGVDDLDIRTTADGQTAVGVGRYINDNTYLGVDSTGRVSIDLDLGADLKIRGAVDAQGSGEVGVFYEGEF
ncbi:translocation/assembly module TamB domain-containing protein [Aurantimonas sp. HBX-1]|uniref:translocation/assembly module TamB domain-containing protein n=1 Tax=Aurantimonas sp. HBX-1 TaxID=2906072 RepID=UPI001F2D1916|nr:translocation/assembly module TamB domain-containing protein [Aurantimonas sp. HBX-1]UIJ71241.1 translocation/assembly module TamB domain-containing protein [Aurantimonas sp. HBX-1]